MMSEGNVFGDAQPSSESPLPPNPYAPPSSFEAPRRSPHPEIWNPNAASNWSVLFTFVFGAFIHARNWKALGEPKKARASYIWFAFGLCFLMGNSVAKAFFMEIRYFSYLGFFLLIAWYFLLGRSQNTYVQSRFGNDYPRKPWFKPLAIAFLSLVFYVGVAAGFEAIGIWRADKALETKLEARINRNPVAEESPETEALPLYDALERTGQEHFEADFRRIVQARLRKERFEELEACAERYRQEKTRFKGGKWKLFRLVDALSRCPGDGLRADDEWKAHLARIEKWRTQSPDSKVAHTALAASYAAWGWAARGGGFAHTISEKNWELFKTRAGKGLEILEQSPIPARNCPMWFYARLNLAHDLATPRTEFTVLFQKAIDHEPEFQAHYSAMARYLEPKWFGEAGDTERWALNISRSIGGEQGDIVYFWIIIHQLNSNGYKFMHEGTFDWPRAVRGFRALEARHGMDRHTLNVFCRLQENICDGPLALELLDRIGDNPDLGVWRTEKYYREFSAWVRKNAL